MGKLPDSYPESKRIGASDGRPLGRETAQAALSDRTTNRGDSARPSPAEELRAAIASMAATAPTFEDGTWSEPIGVEAATAAANARKPYRQPKPSRASARESYRRELALHAEDIAKGRLAWNSDEDGPARRGADGRYEPGKQVKLHKVKPFAVKSERRQRFEWRLANEGAPDCNPRDLPDRVFAVVRAIIWGGGAQAVKSLAEMPPVYASRVRRAALGIERLAGGGWSEPVRGVGHIRARLTIAAGVSLYLLGMPTRRRGMARVVDGLTRGMLANAFVSPSTGERYSISYLFGTKFKKGPADWWDCGPFVALSRAGAILKVQPPADEVPRAYVGPRGWAFNEYWLSMVSVSADFPPAEREQPTDSSDQGRAPGGSRAPPAGIAAAANA